MPAHLFLKLSGATFVTRHRYDSHMLLPSRRRCAMSAVHVSFFLQTYTRSPWDKLVILHRHTRWFVSMASKKRHVLQTTTMKCVFQIREQGQVFPRMGCRLFVVRPVVTAATRNFVRSPIAKANIQNNGSERFSLRFIVNASLRISTKLCASTLLMAYRAVSSRCLRFKCCRTPCIDILSVSEFSFNIAAHVRDEVCWCYPHLS